MQDNDPDSAGKVFGHARTAAEAIRAMNHLTIRGPAIPAPDVYDILGQLETACYRLVQTLNQLSHALEDSLSVCQYDPEPDPDIYIEEALLELQEAAFHADQLAHDIGRTSAAIAGQRLVDLADSEVRR